MVTISNEGMEQSWKSHVLPSLRSPTCYSSLCQSYDTLLNALQPEEADVPEDSILSRETTINAQNADLLRALHLTCCLLIGVLEYVGVSSVTAANGSTCTHPHIKKHDILNQTRRRCKLLLRVLWEQHGGGLPESEHEILNHDILQSESRDVRVVPLEGHPGLYSYRINGDDGSCDTDDSDDDDDDDDGITFDRSVLEAEEQTLIWMASTPIPGEDGNGGEQPTSVNIAPAVNLQAQLQAEWSKEEYQMCQERWHKRQRVS
jgi:hypothetical protein